MASNDNRTRKKWQDYSGHNAQSAELSFYQVFKAAFKNTDYEIISKPTCFKDIYVNVPLSRKDLSEIYNPSTPIVHHGIQPDCLIFNKKTRKTIFIELKRQDGWVENKTRTAGRGNAHERLCKYFTPGLLKLFRTVGKIRKSDLPFWIVFQGDITRDPCRVREITFWFDEYKANYFFLRNTTNAKDLVAHFCKYIAPILG